MKYATHLYKLLGGIWLTSLLVLCVQQLSAQIITTVAGNGTLAPGNDNGPATAAALNTPTRVAVDKNGNVFIADSHHHRIRKVDTNGIITTYAGTDPGGFGGDGGAATSALLNNPVAVAIDNQGNLFIADAGNWRIRKVDANGIMSTVAGTSQVGYTGDGGPATLATFKTLTSLALDRSGNLFIGDQDTYCVRKIDTNRIITTVAGSGIYGSDGDGGAATQAKLANPAGIGVDKQGNLFIADTYAQRVREVATNGTITTVAGTGTAGQSGDGGGAKSTALNYPSDVVVDNQGSLYIAEYNGQRIRKVAPNGIISTVAGTGEYGFSGDGGSALAARFYTPYGLALDTNNNLFIVDLNNERVRKVTGIANTGKAIISVQSGDWLTASTWDCNCVPGSNDTATILAGHSVTVSQSVQALTLTVYGQIYYTVTGKVSF